MARARSLSDPPGKAKFQVNWLAEGGGFISTSQKSFDITKEEVTEAACRLSAPNGAVTGVLYVVPGSSDNLVQYIEMSLYPGSGPKPVSNFMNRSGLAKASFADTNTNTVDRPEYFWEKFNENIPLCFIHIPKTAGHSVYSVFERNYPKDALLIPYKGVEGNINAILNLTPEEIEETKVIAGHMPFGLHNYISKCNYLTFLRDPFELIISGYYFNLENPGAPNHSREVHINRSLLQFAEYYDNSMTRYLIDCAFSEATYWLSGETNPHIKGASYIGLGCDAELTIRTIAVQQWIAPVYSPRILSPGVMEKVAVECSNDNFELDVRPVAVLDLEQDRDLHSYGISNVSRGRYWRIRALSSPQTARWGVVALKLFEQEIGVIPSIDYEHLVVRGVPVCSSAADKCPALHAFDGHDRMAQWQIPLNGLEMRHCEEAMNNLRERFLVGLVERYDQSIDIIGKVLKWSNSANEKRNVSPTLRDANMLSDYEKKQIAEINRYDVVLYEYAQRLFQSDLQYLQARRGDLGRNAK